MGEQAGARELYVDRPEPGRSYVAFDGAFAVALAAFFTFLGFLPLWGVLPRPPAAMNVVALTATPLFGCVAAVELHTLFHVEYLVTHRTLYIRRGRAVRRVPLADIGHVRRIKAAQRVFHDDRFRNRWTDLVELARSWRRPYALSPSDIDGFIAELERRAGRNLED